MRADRHYIPILKGRLGEFNALRNVDEDLASLYTPLIEIVANSDEISDDNGDPTAARVEASVLKSVDRLEKYWPKSNDVIVDLHALPTFESYAPICSVLESFGAEALIPVCRPSDLTDETGLISKLRSQLSVLGRNDICIRLADEDLDERDEPVSAYLVGLLDAFVTEPENVDLVIDFGAVNTESAAFAARIARLVIMDLPFLDRWKSVTLAAGGFPANLDSVPPQVLTELPRIEASMWLTVRERLRDRMRTPGFGDYAIAYPKQLAGVPFAPAPQLRYTAAENWLVLKGRRSDRRSNAQFFDISGQLVEHAEFTPGLSWGDREIAVKAQFANVDPVPDSASPGNAMIWRALGTSHHIALVTRRLTTEGEP